MTWVRCHTEMLTAPSLCVCIWCFIILCCVLVQLQRMFHDDLLDTGSGIIELPRCWHRVIYEHYPDWSEISITTSQRTTAKILPFSAFSMACLKSLASPVCRWVHESACTCSCVHLHLLWHTCCDIHCMSTIHASGSFVPNIVSLLESFVVSWQ